MIFTYYFVPNIGMFLWTVILHIYVYDIYLLFCTWHRNVFLDIPKRIDVSWTFRVCVCVFGFQTEAKKLVFKSFGVVAYFSFSYIYFGKSKRWVKQKVVWVWWFISLFFCWRFFQCYIYILFAILSDVDLWHILLTFYKTGKTVGSSPLEWVSTFSFLGGGCRYDEVNSDLYLLVECLIDFIWNSKKKVGTVFKHQMNFMFSLNLKILTTMYVFSPYDFLGCVLKPGSAC